MAITCLPLEHSSSTDYHINLQIFAVSYHVVLKISQIVLQFAGEWVPLDVGDLHKVKFGYKQSKYFVKLVLYAIGHHLNIEEYSL